MTKRHAALDKFLVDAEVKQKQSACSTCSNEAVRDVVAAYLDKLQLGTTAVTLSYLHRHMIVPQMGGPKSYDAVKRHVHQCLRRDVRTGKAIDDE